LPRIKQENCNSVVPIYHNLLFWDKIFWLIQHYVFSRSECENMYYLQNYSMTLIIKVSNNQYIPIFGVMYQSLVLCTNLWCYVPIFGVIYQSLVFLYFQNIPSGQKKHLSASNESMYLFKTTICPFRQHNTLLRSIQLCQYNS
jgi:hypothetical protein